jgi:protein disulfide-isomerase A6
MANTCYHGLIWCRQVAIFYTASPSTRDSLCSEALEKVATAGSAAKHYVRVVKKLGNDLAEYFEKESKRYALVICCRHLRQSLTFTSFLFLS